MAKKKAKTTKSRKSSKTPATKKKTTKKKAAKKKKVAAKKKAAKKKPAAKKSKKTAPKAAKKAATRVAASPKKKSTVKASRIPVDEHCHLSGKAEVVGDWDAMLNQTNIGANNNKFYVIQLVKQGAKYYTWTRWGRVGETGQSALLGSGKQEDAEKEFEKKFKSKTANNWDKRAEFSAKKGKYALIEIDRSADADKKADEIEEKLRTLDKDAAKLQTNPKYANCKLNPALEKFMTLIFDHKMFQGAMADFDIDVKKMPLGQITKSQVQKGYDVLDSLGKAISSRNRRRINDLSSQFYTVIPHAFGRKVPPPINSVDLLHKKTEMLNVLNDIEIALGMQKASPKSKTKLQPHPADTNYNKLNAKLEPVDSGSDEYQFVEEYMKATGDSYFKLNLVDLFRVDRKGSGDRFKAHDKIKERKLLWHGTSVAVVAAILGNGLRIMPHSGGRVGKGIYLASENGKSIFYCGWSGSTAIMFLVEAALGQEHTITKDDWTLKKPPTGFDSIVARGQTEPDPAKDITWKFDKRDVTIPQGKPIRQSPFKKSSFSQSEYLVYKESQVKIRYVLRVRR